MNEEFVKQRRKKRLDYLIKVYVESDGNPRGFVDYNVIGLQLNLDGNEAGNIVDYLDSELYVEWKSNRLIAITTHGINYVENNFLVSEKERLDPLFDDLLERLKRIETGQKITYDDLHAEIEELKELTQFLSKKNLRELLQGKLVSMGLGKVADEIWDAVISTFRDQNLLS